MRYKLLIIFLKILYTLNNIIHHYTSVLIHSYIHTHTHTHRYRGADKSLARHTSRCILFDCENISFDASLVVYINSTNITPIMIINRIYEHQNLPSR
jgi:hypothetical protein